MIARQGSSLLTTIVWLALIASLGFALAGLSVQHLNASSTQENRQQALLLARSAVSSAIAQLMEDPDFGKKAGPASDLMETRGSENLPEAVGLLGFAHDQGIAWSVNNLGGEAAVPGPEGRTVPQNSAYLIGEGRCGGVVRRVEAILAVPPFPYAIASTGQVQALNGVTIAGVASTVTGPIGPHERLLPADLLSNDASNEAIRLGAGTKVSGNVRAYGNVSIDPEALKSGQVQVQGEILSGAAREKIPHITLSAYEPKGTFTTLGAETLANPAPLGGSFRKQGDMTVTGGLKLDGGVLYVAGDLTVRGGISGKGTVVVTGNLKVEGQSEFQSGNGVALLVGRDLQISGSGPEGSYFQGLVYTEGSFQADRVTLLGTMIAAGEENPRPLILNNTRVLHQEIPLTAPGPAQDTSPVPHLTDMSSLIFGGHFISLRFSQNAGLWSVRVIVTDDKSEPGQDYTVPLGRTLDEITLALAQVGRDVQDHYPNTHLESGDPLWTVFVNQLPTAAGPTPSPGASPAPQGTVMTLDPSSFLRLVERTRVVMWKEG